MILVLNVADEISYHFDLCWCKLDSNNGKVSVLFVHKLSVLCPQPHKDGLCNCCDTGDTKQNCKNN